MKLLACGSNPAAQLSLGHSDDVHTFKQCSFHHTVSDLVQSADIINLVSASTHSLLLLSTSAGNLLLGAGTNSLGQLGPRCALWDEVKPETRFKPIDLLGPAGYSSSVWTPVKIACTWTTSFVVYEKLNSIEGQSGGDVAGRGEHIVLACGSNDFGELGYEPILEGRASDLPTVLDLGLRPGENVQLIKGGQRHVVAVLYGPDGTRAVGWGASRKGELAPTVPATVEEPTTSAKGKSRAVVHPKTLPPTPLNVPVPSGCGVLDIVLGTSHTVILFSDGTLYPWGNDSRNQITGLVDRTDVVQIGATWNGTYTTTKFGDLCSQGSNNHGQLLRPDTSTVGSEVPLPPGRHVKRLVCGSEHIMVLCTGNDGDGELWTGGWNEHGNLCLGDTSDRHELAKVDLSATTIRGAWAGCAASWIWVD